eukprot:scaffold277377_cov35-Tisochrysis_lutea.AAC.1
MRFTDYVTSTQWRLRCWERRKRGSSSWKINYAPSGAVEEALVRMAHRHRRQHATRSMREEIVWRAWEYHGHPVVGTDLESAYAPDAPALIENASHLGGLIGSNSPETGPADRRRALSRERGEGRPSRLVDRHRSASDSRGKRDEGKFAPGTTMK